MRFSHDNSRSRRIHEKITSTASPIDANRKVILVLSQFAFNSLFRFQYVNYYINLFVMRHANINTIMVLSKTMTDGLL